MIYINNYNEIQYKPGYKIKSQDIEHNGYFAFNGYCNKCDENDIYCDEVNIINKIKNNFEGYFNFTKNMIDIGSCLGTYSFILDFNYTYMFEPNKQHCIISEMNMLVHDKFNKYTLYNTLLSDNYDHIKFDGFETNLSYGEKQLEYGFNPDVCIEIKPTILDNYLLENIGFIKIDVEGMEEKVLRGGIGTIIRNNYPPILFELWPVNWNGMTQEKHNSLQKFLEDLGYKIFWEWGQFDTHLAVHKSQLK